MQSAATFTVTNLLRAKHKAKKFVISTILQAGLLALPTLSVILSVRSASKFLLCFYNFRGCDAKLIVKELVKQFDRKTTVIDHNITKYNQIDWGPYIILFGSL